MKPLHFIRNKYRYVCEANIIYKEMHLVYIEVEGFNLSVVHNNVKHS
jgi:hypothetical protein